MTEWDPALLPIVGAAVGILLLLAGLAFALSRRRHRPERTGESGRAASVPLLTRPSGLVGRLRGLWEGGGEWESRLADLEGVLLGADVGVRAAQRLLEALRAGRRGDVVPEEVLRQAMVAMLREAEARHPWPESVPTPRVILVAGVNGVGKTTSIGKLANRFRREGQRVLLVAGDTFRAAAAEQLEAWAGRVGVECVRHQGGSDPAAVVHDGVAAALSRGADVVLVDTAGRLHVKQNLVEELKKIVRVIRRQIPAAPHDVWLVLDGTTGQNGLAQARVFQEALSLTGIVLTKLDGTARGGVVLAIATELGLPVRYVGIGEGMEDLVPFDPELFVGQLLGDGTAEGGS